MLEQEALVLIDAGLYKRLASSFASAKMGGVLTGLFGPFQGPLSGAVFERRPASPQDVSRREKQLEHQLHARIARQLQMQEDA
jgi:hypothetical protein